MLLTCCNNAFKFGYTDNFVFVLTITSLCLRLYLINDNDLTYEIHNVQILVMINNYINELFNVIDPDSINPICLTDDLTVANQVIFFLLKGKKMFFSHK